MTAAARVGCEPPRSAAHAHSGAPGSAARRNDADARRYLRLTLGHTLAMYAVLAAALAGVLPAWTLLLAVSWIYVRLSLGLHELLHVRTADEVPGFHRLAMIFDTPFGLGYREHRAIHLRHHRFAGDARDPERWQIEGSHCRAFVHALITPERSLFNWIRTRGIDASLVRDGAFRCVFFVAVAALNPLVFAVYWITLRACIGVAGFVFHHLLHNRRGSLGTYALPFPPGLVRVGTALFGTEPMLILVQHRAHHLWPDVRVRDLPRFPAAFALPPGPVTPATRAAAARRQTPVA